MAITISQCKGIVVVGWLGEIERARSCILAVTGSDELGNVLSLAMIRSASIELKIGGAHIEDNVIQKEHFIEFDADCGQLL